MREDIEDIDFWNAQFDPESKFNIKTTYTLDVNGISGTLVETYEGTDYESVAVTFKMFKNNSGSWLIEEYREGSNAVVRLIEAE